MASHATLSVASLSLLSIFLDVRYPLLLSSLQRVNGSFAVVTAHSHVNTYRGDMDS